MMRQKDQVTRNDDAISPVIGVMLMLVITIIIAAVVAAFATGLVSDADVAPNVVLDVSLDSCYGSYPMFSIDYVTGDTELDTSKMSIDFTWKCPSCGYTATHHYTANPDEHTTCSGASAALIYPQTEPLWSSEPSLWFGNHIFKAGQTMITSSIYCGWGCLYGASDKFDLIYSNCCMNHLLGSEICEYLCYGCPDYDNCGKITGAVGQELGVIIRYDEHIIYDDVVVVE